MGEERTQRRPRKKSAGPKLLGCLILLLVVAGGLGYMFPSASKGVLNWFKGLLGPEDTDITRNDDRDINTPDVDSSDTTTDIDTSHKDDDSGIPDRDPTLGKYKDDQGDEGDNNLAKKFLKNSAERFNKYEFKRSSEFADQVLGLNCGRKYKDKAKEIKEKCSTLLELTKDLKVNPLADFSNVKIITLSNSSKLKGKILSQSGDTVSFEGDGNMKMKFKKGEILKIESVKADDERAEIIKQFDDRYERGKSSKHALTVYRAGMYGLEYKLDGKGYKALLESMELAKGRKRGIIGVVEEDNARGLLAHAIWLEDSGNIRMAKAKMQECIRKYPKTEAAKKAARYFDFVVARVEKKPEPSTTAPVKNPSGPEPAAPPKEEFKEVKHTASAQGKLADADKLYMEGVKCMQIALKNRPSHLANENFKKAENFFRKALDIYEPIYNKTKDAALDIKMMKINEQLYSSLKLRTAH